MLQIKYIDKIKNKHGIIQYYVIQDMQGNKKTVTSDALKNAIRNNQVECINLTLTSDNRLIDSDKTNNITRNKIQKQPDVMIKDTKIKSGKIYSLYTSIFGIIRNVLERQLQSFGLSNIEITESDAEVSYPTPEVRNYKLKQSNNDNNYISVNCSLDTNDTEISLRIAVNLTGDTTTYYMNGGSHNTHKIIKNHIPQKIYILGNRGVAIDLDNYPGVESHSMMGSSVNTEKLAELYNGQLYSWEIPYEYFYCDEKYVTPILNKVVSVINSYITENKNKLISLFSNDTIYKHVNDFKKLSKDDFETLKSRKVPVYFGRDGAPKFQRLNNLDGIDYNAKYPDITGFRKVFKFNGDLYIWFGRDDKTSIWC